MACKDIRPRARTNITFAEINVGQRVMANYNVDDPEQRGFWYDCIVTKKQDTRTIKDLFATVFIGLVYISIIRGPNKVMVFNVFELTSVQISIKYYELKKSLLYINSVLC